MRAAGPLFLLAALASCGPRIDPDRPPPVHWGEDACATCSMIVSDPRFAACAWLDERGGWRPLAFDDLGCLLERLESDPPLDERRVWVHAYAGSRWIPLRGAHFVRADRLETPMASGLAAFPDAASAERFAREREGKVLSLRELRGG